MAKLNEKQMEEVKKNLDAFTYNFGPVRIERNYCFYYVYYPATDDHFIHRCESLKYLNGWLYGAVQGALIVRPIHDKGAA